MVMREGIAKQSGSFTSLVRIIEIAVGDQVDQQFFELWRAVAGYLVKWRLGHEFFDHDAAWRRVYIVFKVLAGRQQEHVPLAEDRIADKNL